jgi:DNA-binding LytR/AlgR family response regulator
MKNGKDVQGIFAELERRLRKQFRGRSPVRHLVHAKKDGHTSLTVMCGEDALLVDMEDVEYVEATASSLKVHLKGASGQMVCMTMRLGGEAP